MRSIVTFAALALAASVLVPRYASHMGTAPAPLAQAPIAGSAVNSRSIVVPRDARGHFEVDARVDGRHLSFMIDTGASLIALSASNAARLGIHPVQSEFVAEVKTANGTVRAAPTRHKSHSAQYHLRDRNRRVCDSARRRRSRAAGRGLERQSARSFVPVAAAAL